MQITERHWATIVLFGVLNKGGAENCLYCGGIVRFLCLKKKKKREGGCPETHYANKGELKGVAQQWDYAAQTGNNHAGQRNKNIYFGRQKLN